jgi:hypothetical protein
VAVILRNGKHGIADAPGRRYHHNDKHQPPLNQPQPFGIGFALCHQPLRQLIRDWTILDDEERRYALNGATHLDFLIYNRVSKRPVLAIETDGYQFHKQGTRQSERDRMKDRILDRYSLPLLRLSTTGTDEEAKIHTLLKRN